MSSNPILPTDIVERIVGHCGFPVVQAFRKSSNSLRNLVERVSPRSSITSVYMKSNRESIQLHLITGNPKSENAELLFPEGNRLNIEYRPHDEGCCVVLEKEGGQQSTKVLEDEEYTTLFWQDFEILIGYHGDALLEILHVDFEMVDGNTNSFSDVRYANYYLPFVRKLERLVEAHRLKVKNFAIGSWEYQDLLRHLDPDSIERIQASCIDRIPFQYRFRPSWDFMRFNLPQWNMAKHLEVQDFQIPYFNHMFHFETVKGYWMSVVEHDFNEIVESIFTSANPAKQYSIEATRFRFLENLRRIHGDSADNKWFFRSPGADMIVAFILTHDDIPVAFEVKAVSLEEVENVGRIRDWARIDFVRIERAIGNAGIVNDDEHDADGNADDDGDIFGDNEAEDNDDLHVY